MAKTPSYEKGFPCLCHNEMLTVEAFVWSEDEDEVTLNYRYFQKGKYPLGYRLKLMWGLLRNKYIDVGEVVFDPEVANELGWELLKTCQPIIRKKTYDNK